jgi:hypothetical protein
MLVTDRALQSFRKDKEVPKVHLCPVVRVTQGKGDIGVVSNLKARRKRVQRTARFFRPLREWGGKSRGYAMGYKGSWAVEKYDTEYKYGRN